jgi:teichuronic acid biosynthesis glycosyltransferase TuaG
MLNGRRYAKEYVNCLQAQTYTNWEAIVIDDGSNDGSPELLLSLTAGDPRFRLILNTTPREIQGPYQARNTGLMVARGDLICFIDIDDQWLPDKLLRQKMLLDTQPSVKLVYSAYVRKKQSCRFGKIRRKPSFLRTKDLALFANPIPMLTACARKNAIGDTIFPPCNHEDFIFWHSIIKKLSQHEICADKKVVAVYCIRPESLSGNKVRAARWIWLCYREIGYNVVLSTVAILIRCLYQLGMWLMEAFSLPYELRDKEAE